MKIHPEVVFSFKDSKSLKKTVQDIAYRRGLTVSQVLRAAVRQYVQRGANQS